MSNLILSIVVTLIILGGPLTLYAVIKIINLVFGGLKVKFGSVEGNDNLHLLVAWDNESFDDIQVSRAKIEFTELSANGRSKVFSFTFEDNKAKKKSFVIPMNLTSELKACFLDNGENAKAFDNSFFMIEIETVAGETQQFKFSKAKVQKQIKEKLSLDKEIEVIPLTEPDQWSVLTRVFPWRKILPQKDEAAAPKEAAAKGPAAANAPRAPVDFKVTKVWIEPGCIVCDACENEAPSVFWVKEDTCIVRDNAPLDDAAAIKAAADGCPVNVIKFDTVSAKAVG